ncbi:MAG: hypothetical protein ACFCVD_15945 [Nodosilinea sp.]
MKLAWPIHRFSPWSKRLLRTLSFAITSCFLTINLILPTGAAIHPSGNALGGAPEVGTAVLLAQEPNTQNNSTLYFSTPTFTISVHPRNTAALQMNVYNKDTRQAEQLNAPTSFRGSINNDGWVSYDSFGSRNGRNVIYRASGNRSAFQARLEILDASNNAVILSQNSINIQAFNIPEGATGPSPEQNLLANTILSFETRNYAVRVFMENNVKKMNVFNRPSNQQVVNGQPATAELPGMAPYECWVSYFGGQQFNGAPARYYARVSAGGEALIEAVDANGSVLFSEPRLSSSPLVTNIPQADRPQCFGTGTVSSGAALAPFVAAVFGGDSELQQVQQILGGNSGARSIGGSTCTINPRFESARQGQFINAAECDSRDDASAVVNFLRARGLNARLVYRNFRYR